MALTKKLEMSLVSPKFNRLKRYSHVQTDGCWRVSAVPRVNRRCRGRVRGRWGVFCPLAEPSGEGY